MSLLFTMKLHPRPPPRLRCTLLLVPLPGSANSSFRLPYHERDLTGGTDPLARGERRLEAREGPGHAQRLSDGGV